MNDNKVIVSIKNLSAAYEHHTVLHDINLNIYQNDFLGIIGPNGGGKTTLIKCILGLMDYSSRIIDINQQTATVKMIKSKLAEEQLKQYKSENSSQKIIISFVLLLAIGSYIFYRRQKQTTLLKNLKNDDELELRRKKFEVSDIYMG